MPRDKTPNDKTPNEKTTKCLKIQQKINATKCLPDKMPKATKCLMQQNALQTKCLTDKMPYRQNA